MNVFVVVTFSSYGETPEIAAIYTDQSLAEEHLEEFIDESLAHSGFVEEKELVDMRG